MMAYWFCDEPIHWCIYASPALLKSVDPISVPNIYALRKYVFNVEILFIIIDSEEH